LFFSPKAFRWRRKKKKRGREESREGATEDKGDEEELDRLPKEDLSTDFIPEKLCEKTLQTGSSCSNSNGSTRKISFQ
jgi:hypothetical protein